MSLLLRLRLSILLVMAIGVATACEQVVAPPTPNPPTATRPPDTPSTTPAVIAFPTAVPSLRATVTPTPQATATALPPLIQRLSSAPPLVQLVSPGANASISIFQTVSVVIYASADAGVSRVELTDDGVIVRSESAPSPIPVFSAIIPWSPIQIGPHVLRAVAYDANNRPSGPDEVTVTVITDSRRPTSIIVYPIGIPQIEFGSILPIYGVATDEVGVTQVDLWVDNQIYTYLTSPNSGGQTAMPFVFNWGAFAPGNHTFLVRAHDNQDQTTDSAPLKILVVDTQSPSLSVTFDRTNALAGEPITITISALDASGIQRIELLSGKDIISTMSSPNPSRQTFVTTQVVWQNQNPGDYPIIARAHSATGISKESPPQIVSILRPGQATPTPVPTTTPTRTRIRPTTTPRSQPPAPPKAEIVAPADRFSMPSPLRVTFNGQGNAELDRIELWGYYPGQPNPQIVCTIDSHATTQKAGQCDWTPPLAGFVTLFAQSIDIYHQAGRSALVSGYITLPVLPTPTPTPPSPIGRWNAITSTGPMTVTLRQSGTTLRGDFRMAGIDADGRIPSVTIKADKLSFHVDFALPSTPTLSTDTPATLSMDFDCTADLTAGTLGCSFRDSRGRSGAALFRRDISP